jgi:4-amino-4-deoxy-L-arabinose transferase-like glycosyltransferase
MNLLKSLKSRDILLYWLGYCLIFAITFLGLIWRQNLYAPLTEGWWHVYSRWLSDGLIPYRDFNLIVPPGMPYINWFVTSLVGENFLVLRYFGVLIAALIAALIFSMLAKVVDQIYALILTLAGVLLFYSTEVVVMFDYNYCAILFLILGCFFWHKTLESDVLKQPKSLYALLSGLSLGLSFLVKFNFVFYFMIFLLVSQFVRFLKKSQIGKSRQLLKTMFTLGLGFLAPIALTVIYFGLNGALEPLYRSLFLEAPAAKGGFPATLINWIGYLRNSFSFRLEFATFVFFILSLVGADRVLFPAITEFSKKVQSKTGAKFQVTSVSFWFSVLVATFLTSIFTIFQAAFNGELGYVALLTKHLAYLSLPHSFVIPVFFSIFGFIWSVSKPDRERWQPLFILSLSLIWATGSSGGLNWYATGFASVFMIAWLTRLVRFHNEWKGILALYLLAIFTSLSVVWAQTPYSWWGYRTAPTFDTSVTSTTGLTKGLRFDIGTYFIFSRVKEQLATAKSCEGGAVVFPNMPIFQLDNNVQPEGRNGVYWFDFTSKRSVMEDLNHFRETPPASIVLLKVPQGVWDGHSNAFNAGQPFYAQKQLYTYLKSFENNDSYVSNTYNLPSLGEYKPYRIPTGGGYSLQVITKKSCENERE